MTQTEKKLILKSLLALYGKVELQTPTDRNNIESLYKLLREIEG